MRSVTPSVARRAILWALIAVLLGWLLLQLRTAGLSGDIPLYDFIEYWAAGRLFLRGENPYGEAEMLGLQRTVGWDEEHPVMMWNPPWTLVLVTPFAVLPFWIGRGLWFIVHLIFILAVSDWLWRYLGGSLAHRWISWLLAVFFIPDGTALYLGQIGPLMLGGIAGFLWALEKRHDLIAGLWTLPIAVKPQLLYLFWILLLLWICKEGRWRVLAGGILALSACLLPIYLVNPSTISQYVAALGTGYGPLIWQTPSWGVALLRLSQGSGPWLRFVPTFMGILLGFWLWWRRRRAFSWKAQIAPVLLLSIITTSFTWMFDWVLLLPLIITIAIWFRVNPKRNWWLLAGLAATQVALLFQPSLAYSNFYAIWLPPALGLLYLAGRRYAVPDASAPRRRESVGGGADQV